MPNFIPTGVHALHQITAMILPEYLETVFTGAPPLNGWPSEFHILTAYNPKRILTESENLAANVRLGAQLEREAFEYFAVTGCSADFLHQEAGWGVLGMTPARAVQIGREYGQNAVFEIIGGEAFVVSCDTLERRSIGPFQSRVKPAQPPGTE